MLLALIGFMPSDGLGTIGSLDCSSEARQHLARRLSGHYESDFFHVLF